MKLQTKETTKGRGEPRWIGQQLPPTRSSAWAAGLRGLDSPAPLWQAPLRGEDLATEVPRERWDADECYDPEDPEDPDPGVAGRFSAPTGDGAELLVTGQTHQGVPADVAKYDGIPLCSATLR